MATNGQFTDGGADAALTAVFKTGTLYLGLCTQTLTDSSTNAPTGEEDDAAYARIAVTSTFGAPYADAGVRKVKNTADITFGPWTLAASPAITHVFLTDDAAGAGGTILYWWELATAKTPGAGDTFTLPANLLIAGLE